MGNYVTATPGELRDRGHPTTVVDWDQAAQRWLEPAIKMVITH